jgi:hypothetical protein
VCPSLCAASGGNVRVYVRISTAQQGTAWFRMTPLKFCVEQQPPPQDPPPKKHKHNNAHAALRVVGLQCQGAQHSTAPFV